MPPSTAPAPPPPDDIGLKIIISGFDLPLAEVRTALQFAVISHRPLHCAALHRAATVDEAKAPRLLNEDLQDRFGAAEIIVAPPLGVGLDDRKRAEPLGAMRNEQFTLGLGLFAGRCFLVDLRERWRGDNKCGEHGGGRKLTHDDTPRGCAPLLRKRTGNV
jgi:hypothetical protein